jgi:hypothetical protein
MVLVDYAGEYEPPYTTGKSSSVLAHRCHTLSPVPPILHISREARTIGLKFYDLGFEMTQEVGIPRATITFPPRIYVNWDCDTICPIATNTISTRMLDKLLIKIPRLQSIAINMAAEEDIYRSDWIDKKYLLERIISPEIILYLAAPRASRYSMSQHFPSMAREPICFTPLDQNLSRDGEGSGLLVEGEYIVKKGHQKFLMTQKQVERLLKDSKGNALLVEGKDLVKKGHQKFLMIRKQVERLLKDGKDMPKGLWQLYSNSLEDFRCMHRSLPVVNFMQAVVKEPDT